MKYKEVKDIRNNHPVDGVDNKELAKMIDVAIEKQIAKKPIYHENECCFACSCGNVLFAIGDVIYPEYCSKCGQKLDWSEEK